MKYKIVFYGGSWVLSEQFKLVGIQVFHYVNLNTGALFSTIINKLIIMSRMIFSAYELRIYDKTYNLPRNLRRMNFKPRARGL